MRMSVISWFCQSSSGSFSAHLVAMFVAGCHFESPCTCSEAHASCSHNHAHEAWLYMHCHGSQSRIATFVDCWVKKQRARDTTYQRCIAYLDIWVSWGTYLAGQDGSQVTSIHYNTVPANDREPSLHCVMTVSNLLHFVATKLYKLGLWTSTVLQSKCHVLDIEQLVPLYNS